MAGGVSKGHALEAVAKRLGFDLKDCIAFGDGMNDAEMLWEERIMLENLTVKDCMFHDTTVLNTYTIQGRLPEEKASLLDAIDMLLASCGF